MLPPRLLLLLAALLCAPLALTAAPLTLLEAERLARADDPASQRYRELAAARREAAVAAGQLPDPMLIAEVMDLPADSLRLDEDSMTQLRVGLRQSFPRGDSRRLSSAREGALGEVETARAAEAERALLRAVRSAYLELHYQRAALAVLTSSRPLFEDLLDITEREFAAGRATQQDVLRAELELERLEDRLAGARGQERAAAAELARWIGAEAAARPLPSEPPALAAPAAELASHPALTAEQATLQASRHGIELARQGYRPQWSLEVTYGRQTAGADMGGSADRLSAMVMVDLPLFTRQRQDRDVAASLHQRDAAEHALELRQRELLRELGQAEARWQQLSERERRYGDRLLPRSAANAEAAEQAYRARTTDFTELMRARLLELETRLEALRIASERGQAQANLLYLLGEEQV